jgi:hypothetical protein
LVEYALRRKFDKWDVLVASSTRGERPVEIQGLKFGPQLRAGSVRGSGAHEAVAVSGKKLRVASRGQEAAGLSDEVRKEVVESWRIRFPDKSVPDKLFRAKRERPLLMLHILDVKGDAQWSGLHAAYGISFPSLRPGETEERVTYQANLIRFRELYGDVDAYGDEEDENVAAE